MARSKRVFWAALSMALALAPALSGAAERWETLPAAVPLPTPRTQGWVDHDGARLWYETFGVGAPVILLHGGLANSDYWGGRVPALAASGHRAIVIDSRGHGRSSRDARPFTYQLMASDVTAVIDALHIPRAAVVGWSDGAIIGLVLALKDPERVTRVFAFAANMDPSGVVPNVESVPTFARFIGQTGVEYARLYPTPAAFPAFAAAIGRVWDTEPHYSAADLATISTPVAIADGDHDEAITRAQTLYLARTIPGATLRLLPGVSHFAMLQDPAGFNRAMIDFLDGRSPEPAARGSAPPTGE